MPKKPEWYDDPEIQEQERHRRVRNGLKRSAIIWTPFFLLFAGLFLFYFIDIVTGGHRGTWVFIVILATLTTLFGVQSYQSISDLTHPTKTTTGRVTRRWARSDSLIIKSHYIRIGRQIFRGDVLVLDQVKAGSYVEVEYYPHSSVVLNLKRLPDPTADEVEHDGEGKPA